mmetsp:Transcript_12452/g.34570  ORF Transcript_12452/g.34570 Transcript_12452/m.34570 type:complete len:399 (-) Transcript_12452:78-1274(-)
MFCRRKTIKETSARSESDEKKGWWGRFRRFLTIAWWTMVIIETVVSIGLEICCFLAPVAMADFEVPEYLAPLAPLINQTVATATAINNNNPLVQYLVAANQSQNETMVHRERSFLEIASKRGSHKVLATTLLEACRRNQTGRPCPAERSMPSTQQQAQNPLCRVNGNYYDSMYQRWLGHWSREGTDSFLLINVGVSPGDGLNVFREFLPAAEVHGVYSSCPSCDDTPFSSPSLSPCKKPFSFYHLGRVAHCIDVRDTTQLQFVWRTEANHHVSPLKVVVDDGEHKSSMQMAQSIFFWFPRLEPGGMLFLENIQENTRIRRHFLPQLAQDVHWCGDYSSQNGDAPKPCFPTIQPLLKSFHCELHICVLERNHVASSIAEQDISASLPPSNALNSSLCSA